MPASLDKRFATKEVHTCQRINVHCDLEIKRFSLGGVFMKMFPFLWRQVAGELLQGRNGKAIWDQGELLVEF